MLIVFHGVSHAMSAKMPVLRMVSTVFMAPVMLKVPMVSLMPGVYGA